MPEGKYHRSIRRDVMRILENRKGDNPPTLKATILLTFTLYCVREFLFCCETHTKVNELEARHLRTPHDIGWLEVCVNHPIVMQMD